MGMSLYEELMMMARDAATARRAARLAADAASRAARWAAASRPAPPPHLAPRARRSSPQIEHVPGKSVTKEDLESDEATQALYERWCKAYNKQRDQGDMARRFNIFKEAAEDVYKSNKVFMYEPEKQRRLGPAADGFNAQEFAEHKSGLARLGFHIDPDDVKSRLVEDIPDQSPPNRDRSP
ncbi:hypothetical protein U9M48_022818 [Paspalum notatum var. saurae]|uniref:Cathepsin propeptide inhibitor domain-containing protein n=1 Tax=Paspalum notatum var. saurae TaxID=547442 RepID=A0AAQ3TKC5_PASNO